MADLPTVGRKDASPWAIDLWEALQDVLSNEEAWALLDAARGEALQRAYAVIERLEKMK